MQSQSLSNPNTQYKSEVPGTLYKNALIARHRALVHESPLAVFRTLVKYFASACLRYHWTWTTASLGSRPASCFLDVSLVLVLVPLLKIRISFRCRVPFPLSSFDAIFMPLWRSPPHRRCQFRFNQFSHFLPFSLRLSNPSSSPIIPSPPVTIPSSSAHFFHTLPCLVLFLKLQRQIIPLCLFFPYLIVLLCNHSLTCHVPRTR